MSLAVLLLLADGRLPAGGHAHSGGLEEAVASGRVRDTDDLASFLRGRLATVGCVDAALAVAAWARTPDWLPVDAEAAARCPSPAWRGVSRRQGHGLVRAARRMWTGEALDALAAQLPQGPMWPVAVGAVGAAAALMPTEVALVAAHAAVTGPAWAATRLLGVDPFAVAACLAALTAEIDQTAACACRMDAAGVALAALPADTGLLLDIGAEIHAGWEVRLFAS
jgi:urease accessory protein